MIIKLALLLFLPDLISSNRIDYFYDFYIRPSETIIPKVSGVRAIIYETWYSSLLVFSGNIDATTFASNMMIISNYSVALSSTSTYPDDRSYYGMINSKEGNYLQNSNLAIVFGGLSSEGVLGDVWQYYIEKDFWKKIDFYLPEPVYDFAYATYYDDYNNETNIVILGGIDNSNRFVNNSYWCILESKACPNFTNYQSCTENGLASAQLVLNYPTLYLFSGFSYTVHGFIVNFDGLCISDYENKNTWVRVELINKFKNYTHGGSCTYKNNIYFFFGSLKDYKGIKYNDKIYKLDLSDLESGWSEIDFKCPENFVCARDSFGIACDSNTATIIGGKTSFGSTNSRLTINMDNFEVTDFKKEAVSPSPRAFSTLTKSSSKLILFGGKNRDFIFDDIWELDMMGEDQLGTWSLLSILGSSPGPRFRHAAATQGIFTIFVGGQTYENRIISEIWLLNTLSNTWTQLIPSESSDYQIPALTGTCAMLDLPKLYFIGGMSYSGVSFDLWEYDLSTNKLSLLRKKSSLDVGTFGHACQLIKKDGKVIFYTLYGFVNTLNDIYYGIRQFDITDTKNIKVNVTRESPKSMQCRGNFGYTYNGRYIIIIGGEIFPDMTFRDIWFINIEEEDNYEELMLISLDSGSVLLLDKPLSGSSVIAFSDYIITFSGFYDGGFSAKSDISASIYYIPTLRFGICNFGFYLKDEKCELCLEGTYCSNTTGSCNKCNKCPAGTTHNVQAASHISQCVPCPKGKYYNINSTVCLECPKNYLCPVGSQEPLDPSVRIKEQQSQPLNFIKPSAGYSLIFIASAFSATIIIYLILFCSSLLIRVVFSAYDFFRPNHIIPRNEKSFEEDFSKISFVGGFFTGLIIIVIAFNFAYLIIQYKLENENEIRSLVPLSSLIQEQEYNNNSLTLHIYMYSYRGNCKQNSEINSDFFNFSHSRIIDENISEYSVLCTHSVNVSFNTLFTFDSYIELSFTGYTSDIALIIEGESGNPNEKSSFTQVLESKDGDVLIGVEPSIFSISLIPAYYNYKGYFGDPLEKLGFRLGAVGSPTSGSEKSIENIYLNTGFKIRAQFILSEFGITTYRFQEIDPISFILSLLATAPGLISLTKFLLVAYEKIYYKIKNISTKQDISIKEQYNKIKNGEENNAPETNTMVNTKA
ncbi:hypothetical protein SteCoe_7814 [Stentor coeruleus]|uniref:Tyrosine-protein kinase ephrin type A/B receptor-like domain-containing protein n=1 Tax=Stentor coeruleus TaxID=5963 RepID=A0A1R2CLT8_9CILI|nr:hypothetical protein SteCoe_7814 [Stentor coeruleus]